MPVDPNDPRLTAYALGELDDESERSALAAEIEQDPEALAYVEAIREMAGLLTEELRGESAAAVATGLDPELERQLNEVAPAAVLKLEPRAGSASGWFRYALAASLLLAMGGTALVVRHLMTNAGKSIELAMATEAPAPPSPKGAAPASNAAPALFRNAPADPANVVPPGALPSALAPDPGAEGIVDAKGDRKPGVGEIAMLRRGIADRESAALEQRRGMMGGAGGFAPSQGQRGRGGDGAGGGREFTGRSLAAGPAPASTPATAPAPAPGAPARSDSDFVMPAPIARSGGERDFDRNAVPKPIAPPAPRSIAGGMPGGIPLPSPAVATGGDALALGAPMPGGAVAPAPRFSGSATADVQGKIPSPAEVKDLKAPEILQRLSEPAVGGKAVEEPRIVEKEKLEAGIGREQYAPIVENVFKPTLGNELSTFSIDVDTAAYANVRRFINEGRRPPRDAVRIEEMVNYFPYDDPEPTGPHPFSVNVEIAACPWNADLRLARVALKGKTVDAARRPPSNLVFLVDVSGSMNDLNKLPLLKAGLKLLVRELTENDRVAIVVYAGEVRVVLPSTPCHDKAPILAAVDKLGAGGSTAGGAGIEMAYREAVAHFIKGGTNRVILATDGDFNVGLSKEELLKQSEERAKTGVFLTVLGFGEGNLQEAFMEQLADKGNGSYVYIDSIAEARKVLVREMSGTLVTIAKDVKIQVEFNPAKVSSYRLIGYENRALANKDFRDDKKDAGEIGAGHGVTAFYELTPADAKPAKRTGDGAKTEKPLKYGSAPVPTRTPAPAALASPESLTVSLRYKAPDADKAREFDVGVVDKGLNFGQASPDFKFGAAVAGFGLLLRDSPFKGSATYSGIAEIAGSAAGTDPSGYRNEFVELVRKAQEISGP